MRLFNDINDTILVYRSLTGTTHLASLLGFLSMADFTTIPLGHWHGPRFYCHPDAACRVPTNLLAKRILVAFTPFLGNRYLQFLGSMFREASVPTVSEYVAGAFAMQHRSDGAMDAAALRQHIDYLHDPHNPFTTCSILATRDIENKDRVSIFRNTTTLVQLRP
ncbi:hypothetical protein F5146DRAFT_1032111 [Armillaria mellea]|nr:hypothetical protein F5146DRAFT_1032111 [Armillaria mellea]